MIDIRIPHKGFKIQDLSGCVEVEWRRVKLQTMILLKSCQYRQEELRKRNTMPMAILIPE